MAKGKYEQWRTPEGKLKLAAWARDGLTNEQIAKNMGISRSTLDEWCKKYPDISDTLKINKEVADIVIENSLYSKAKGIRTTVKKAIKLKEVTYKDGKRLKETERVEIVDEELFIPPDTTAGIFWLQNRKPDVWKNRQSIEAKVQTEKLEDLL